MSIFIVAMSVDMEAVQIDIAVSFSFAASPRKKNRKKFSRPCRTVARPVVVYVERGFEAGSRVKDRITFKERDEMRVMVIIKANAASEAGVMPSGKMLSDMGKFNEELVKAGVMLAGEGLRPSSKGKRVRFEGTQKTVIDGPFAETKELIAGFWLWQVRSLEEAVEWGKRIPAPNEGDPGYGEVSEIEIRPVGSLEDFGADFTPELREQEERLRAQIEEQQQKS